MQSSEIYNRLSSLKSRASKVCYSLNYAIDTVSRLQDEKKKIEEQVAVRREGSIVVAKAIEDTHRSLETSIVDVVNTAMAIVFPEPYTLSFKLTQRGKETKTSQVLISLKKDGVEIDKHLHRSIEGGMLTIVSLVLRIAFMSLKPDLRKVLLLDETFGAIARKTDADGTSALERTFSLVEKVAKEFGIQMIIVTHTGAEEL